MQEKNEWLNIDPYSTIGVSKDAAWNEIVRIYEDQIASLREGGETVDKQRARAQLKRAFQTLSRDRNSQSKSRSMSWADGDTTRKRNDMQDVKKVLDDFSCTIPKRNEPLNLVNCLVVLIALASILFLPIFIIYKSSQRILGGTKMIIAEVTPLAIPEVHMTISSKIEVPLELSLQLRSPQEVADAIRISQDIVSETRKDDDGLEVLQPRDNSQEYNTNSFNE
jgi:hypothetical protein